VVAARGRFEAGSTVEVVGPSGRAFARGMVTVDAATVTATAGRHTRDLPPDVAHEVIHRDDLVVLP
jgi:glutamate 5-kinase